MFFMLLYLNIKSHVCYLFLCLPCHDISKTQACNDELSNCAFVITRGQITGGDHGKEEKGGKGMNYADKIIMKIIKLKVTKD